MNLWNDPARTVDDRVEALLAAMSTQEKVFQLGSWWPMESQPQGTVAGDAAPRDHAPGALSMSSRLADAADRLYALGLGHLTRPFGRHPQTVAQGVAALREWHATVIAKSPHGVPPIMHEESLTGFTTWGATVYPAPLAWGASFDPALVEEMATAIGDDLHAVGVDQALSPLLDVTRDYRWGRVEETCGEDPYVVATLGTAYVRGLQSAGVSATLKHFVGYAASQAGRNLAPVHVGRRELEDVLLPPFEMAVREGAVDSVMNNYSDVDGVPCAASEDLLTHVLRDRWGFEGTVVSDYFALVQLLNQHHVAHDLAEAAALGLKAGMDVDLPFGVTYLQLGEALERGLIDEDDLDRSVRRVLRHKVRRGLLDEDFDPSTLGDPARDLDSPRNRDIARRLGEESVVLLANDGTLPLAPGRRLAVVGPTADEPLSLMGCYAFPNHVLQGYSGDSLGLSVPTVRAAVEAEFGPVAYAAGVPIREVDTSGIAQAVAAAQQADVVVLCVGDLPGMFGHGTSGEGCDVADLHLPGSQEHLVQAVLDTGTPVVLVVSSGRPYAIGEFTRRCAAVVQAFLPGCEGAAAITGVLSGRINPSGKLPVQIPRSAGAQPGTYLGPHFALFAGSSNLDPAPAFAFGHGLSYTSFDVSELELSADDVPTDGSLSAACTVTNNGDRTGTQVVQLYGHDVASQVVRPLKELLGYARVDLAPGESKRVTFEVHTDRLSFTGLAYRRIVEPGPYELMLGTSSVDLPLTATIALTGDTRVVGEGRVLTTPVTIR